MKRTPSTHEYRLDNEDASQAATLIEWLKNQSQKELVQLLLELANSDEHLMHRLSLVAEMAQNADKPHALHALIDETTDADLHGTWRVTASLVSDIESVVQMLQKMLNSHQVTELPSLCEYALYRLEQMLEQLDDSHDALGWSLQELQVLHLEACERTHQDPLDLAQQLFNAEMNACLNAFYESSLNYEHLLGETGMRRFRELAQEQWQQMHSCGEGQEDDEFNSWRLTHIMETLARQSGDIEALVAIKKQDLTTPYDYLTIAELYQQAGNTEQALQWAEQGAGAFDKQRTDPRLSDFLAERYLERDRQDEALALIWHQFEVNPCLDTWKKLHDMAQRLGCWPVQRARALDRLNSHPPKFNNKQSLLLEIALLEQDLPTAWSISQTGECRESLLLQLAEAMESEQPRNAATLYQQLIPKRVEKTNNTAYAEAIKLLKRVAPLVHEDEFDALCQDLYQRYKAKRNFIGLLKNI